MRTTLSLFVLLASAAGVTSSVGKSFPAGQVDLFRRIGEALVADPLLHKRQTDNGNGNGNGNGKAQSGITASNGTVVNQAQEGDSATVAGSQKGQKQNNSTAAANTASAGSQGGKAPPANIVDTGDPQKNLFLDPSQIAKGLALDGQQVPADNQVASATSVNNFINSCLLRTDLVKTGSCNAVPMGVIAAADKAPSSKFTNPKNLDVVPPDQTFTITMAINNLVTGNFVNAQQNYFSAPQATDKNGIIIGHSHVVVEQIANLQSTAVTNPQEFAFFKGFNEAAVNGVLSATVNGGLAAGTYKLTKEIYSINSAANHQPALTGVAQHGSLDDAVYFVRSPSTSLSVLQLHLQHADPPRPLLFHSSLSIVQVVSNDANAVATQLGGGQNANGGGAASSSSAAAGGNGAATTSAAAGGGNNQNQGGQQTTSAATGGQAATTSAAAAATTTGSGNNRNGNGRFGGFGRNRNGNKRLSRIRNRLHRVKHPRNAEPEPESENASGTKAKSLLERRLEDMLRREVEERDVAE
ncbi:hypothetical protein JCM11641_000609 [Rhodosporidiobolus odoratus]